MGDTQPMASIHSPDVPGEPGELCALAVDIATEVGHLLTGALNRTSLAIDAKSSPTDLVTEMDRAAEQLIARRLAQARPHDAIVGEEGTDKPGSTGVRWVIDPIDGTTNFVYGHPGFAVSIAAEVDGQPTVGVVCDPLHAETFTAVHTYGAWRNGEPISVSSCTEMPLALVATGFSYQPERRRLQAEVLGTVLPEVRDIRRMGAASTDLCSVACGRVDAYYERGLKPWDYAAGALIATEAGAVVTDGAGGGPSPEFTVACTPGLAGPFTDLLRQAGAHRA